MAGKRFKDFRVGDKFLTAAKTITDAYITTLVSFGGFVAPFFLDEEYARTTPFGGRIAPGRATLLLMGGLVEQSEILDLDGVIALLGLDKIRFTGPLRPGDTIRVELEILEKKLTSRGDRGIMVQAERCLNQRGEVILVSESTHLMKLD